MPPSSGFLLALALLVCCPRGAAAQTALAVHGGSVAAGHYGRVLVSLPDLDGDGIEDYATGMPFYSGPAGYAAGRVEVISTASGSVLLGIDGLQAGEQTGAALAVLDWTGDGVPELAIGVPLDSNGPGGNGAGRVDIVDPTSGSSIAILYGALPGHRFGSALASLGNQQGGLAQELAVGAPGFDGAAGSETGRISAHDPEQGGAVFWAVEGGSAFDFLGSVLAGTPDLDLDFRPDLVAGVPRHDGPNGVDSGRIQLLAGSDGSNLGSVDGASAGERFGWAVVGVPDQDGDALADVIAGAPHSGASFEGRIEAISSATLLSLWTSAGTSAGDNLGASLALVGDVDGDLVSDLAAGAPLADGAAGLDSGCIRVFDAATGTTRFEVEGSTAFGQFGFALCGEVDADDDGRPEVLASAPFATLITAQEGLVSAIASDLDDGLSVRSYRVGSRPEKLAVIDAEGDGDLDLLVVDSVDCTVRILWNGDHSTSGINFDNALYDQLPQTVLSLSSSAMPTSIAAANIDGDAACEIFVGLSDGKMEVIDGSGSVGAPSFASLAAPIEVDPRLVPGPLRSLAPVPNSSPAAVAVAIGGGLGQPGQLRVLTDPLGTPAVGAPLAEGGNFVWVGAADLDLSGDADLISANAATGANGGVQIFSGPSFASSYSYSFSAPPMGATLGALDPDGQTNDLVIAQTGFTGGGASVLSDYQSGSGFNGPFSAGILNTARCVGVGLMDEGAPAAVIADGQGNLFRFGGWVAGAFTTATPLPVGSDVSDLRFAQLIASNDRPGCEREELAVVVRGDGVVRVVIEGLRAHADLVPLTGCPPEAPVSRIGIAGTPVIGDFGFGVTLTNATPSAPANLVVQLNPLPGTPPLLIFPTPACGVAFFDINTLFLPAATDANGEALLPLPLPNDPLFLCIEGSMQWAVTDGGPVFGLTLSDALVLRVGEYY